MPARIALAAACALALLVPASASAVSFSGPVNFSVSPGDGPTSVGVGDFDADADPDLGVTNNNTSDVSILLGDGTGGFGVADTFGVGSSPQSVAVGSFDAGTGADLAVANFNSDNVSILLGDGTGGFGAATSLVLGVGTHPASVAVGSFDAGTGADLAVANFNSDNVSILLGDGTGDFTAAGTLATGTEPKSIAVGDFDADADADLAVANFNSDNVSILLGDGTGDFTGPTNFAAGTTPSSVAVGDFDADADADLAVTNTNSGNVSILRGDGTGTFTGPTSFAVGTAPGSVAVGDFNGDSGPDLAVANLVSDNVSILLGVAEPSLAADAADGTVGQPITDSVTLAAGYEPTGTIVFELYGPDDPTCSETPLFTDAVPVSGNGSYASGPYVPTQLGEYRWIAEYGGDADNEAVAGSCGDLDQTSTVAKAVPTLTPAAADGTVGQPISAGATLAGGFQPAGEITFRAYGPGDADCLDPPAFEATVDVDSGNGDYESGPYTPIQAGDYRWTTSYSGDADNEAVDDACDASGQSSVVAKAKTETTVSSSLSSATEGDAVTLTATVAGFEPGGEVVFRKGGATLGSAPLDDSGHTTFSTGSLAVGSHDIVARYEGDANNDPSESAPFSVRVEARPLPPRPSCPQASPSPSNYTPTQKMMRVRHVPGVRARIAVAAAAQLQIEAKLRFRRNGRSRSADLGTHSLGNPGSRNLRLPLPASLRRALPLGTKVRLRLTISASTGCGEPQVSRRSVRTRVVRVLAG